MCNDNDSELKGAGLAEWSQIKFPQHNTVMSNYALQIQRRSTASPGGLFPGALVACSGRERPELPEQLMKITTPLKREIWTQQLTDHPNKTLMHSARYRGGSVTIPT